MSKTGKVFFVTMKSHIHLPFEDGCIPNSNMFDQRFFLDRLTVILVLHHFEIAFLLHRTLILMKIEIFYPLCKIFDSEIRQFLENEQFSYVLVMYT